MSVRRLAPPELQPASFPFTAEPLAWAKQQLSHVSAILGSLDIVFGEVDR
jgi:NADH:ubiquinone oxidoreductase subunit D